MDLLRQIGIDNLAKIDFRFDTSADVRSVILAADVTLLAIDPHSLQEVRPKVNRDDLQIECEVSAVSALIF